MKCVVAGSRSITDYAVICKAISEVLAQGIEITEIVSGTAAGVDRLGERWAKENGIAIKCFPANWTRFGKSAGYKRNEEMANYSQIAIVIWDRISKGSQHMINLAKKHKLQVFVFDDKGNKLEV